MIRKSAYIAVTASNGIITVFLIGIMITSQKDSGCPVGRDTSHITIINDDSGDL